ncbi:unnamed protein product [Cuscuta epithymum]|uniref:Uncharacterized protein n=1 Tax=Cuscuta epithymum TaxID=186058 RepID=A0AAV0CA12_9ASTE|nr:unnamed protein product [Cuscuta epithymum]
MIPLEVAGQTSSSFPVTSKIEMIPLEVVVQTSSPFLVAGKIRRLDLVCRFSFKNPCLITPYLSSKFSSGVRLAYIVVGLANMLGPSGLINSMFHPSVGLRCCIALALVILFF